MKHIYKFSCRKAISDNGDFTEEELKCYCVVAVDLEEAIDLFTEKHGTMASEFSVQYMHEVYAE